MRREARRKDRNARFGDDRGERGFGGARRFGGRDDGPKRMYSAVCSDCGRDCEVPFRPTNGKPVYCSDCFSKNKSQSANRGGRGFGNNQRDNRGRDGGEVVNLSAVKDQLELLNRKLDEIMKVLIPTLPIKEKREKVVVVKALGKKANVKEVKEAKAEKKVAKLKNKKKSKR